MRRVQTVILVVMAIIFFGLLANAATNDILDRTDETPAISLMGDDLVDGEIRNINKDRARITIRHGPIRNLDMPKMTMVFQVDDPTVLDALTIGDSIRFKAKKKGTSYVVTEIHLLQ